MAPLRDQPANEPPPEPYLPDDPRLPGGNPWLLIFTIVGAKIATIVVILFYSWTGEAGLMVLLTSWHWLIYLGALITAPVALYLRLRHARARRDDLRRAEWIVDEEAAPASRFRPR